MGNGGGNTGNPRAGSPGRNTGMGAGGRATTSNAGIGMGTATLSNTGASMGTGTRGTGMGNGAANRGGGRGRGNLGKNSNSPQRAPQHPFGGAFAPRVPSMAPNALGVQDRGDYDDSHIRECDKVDRIGRNVGLIGPDSYVLSHKDAKYYESSKLPPAGFSVPKSGSVPQNARGRGGNIRGGTGRPHGNTPPFGHAGTSSSGGRNVSPGGINAGGNRSPSPRANMNQSPRANTNQSPRSNVNQSPNRTPAVKAETNERCCICGQDIFGSYMVVGSYSYHKHCANCDDCNKNVFRDPFYQLPNSFYLSCQVCYERKHSKKCGKCGKGVISNGILAIDKAWHRECFTCVRCNSTIGTATQWYNMNGTAVCGRCA